MAKFKCCNCKENIDPWKPICPYCETRQPNEYRANYLDREIIYETCQKCGCKESFYATSRCFDDCICCNCGNETYYNDEGKEQMPQFKPSDYSPIINCPYCNSTDVKKISTASKAGRVAIWGIFSIGKVTKQWHCNNCKSDF